MTYAPMVTSGSLPRMKERVIIASDQRRLGDIADPEILAVMVPQVCRPSWNDELEREVIALRYVQPRVILNGSEQLAITERVEKELTASPLSKETRAALAEDLLGLVSLCRDLTGSTRFRFRFFTDVPNCRCSYHVDVVPPSAAQAAVLRVYCGARTQYIDPNDLTCWEDFYAYVFRREKLQKEMSPDRLAEDAYAAERARAALERLEERLPFLRAAADPRTVPADAIVACKLVDSRHLWGRSYVNTRLAKGWIHRSPIAGMPRFVASVNATD